jgi:glycosyltransferase involved in cell wall biosynthesis
VNDIRLSICIATRNRAKLIGATLESIFVQATEEVEIVILDGASTDNTEEVIRRYQTRSPRLRYFRQETNMGIDRDFAKAVDLAHGEYCWLFCDDDLFKPGAIQVVLEALRNDYSLVIADSEVRNADLSQLLQAKRTRVEANKVYKPDENHLLLGDAGDYLSFIGGVIIKRQLWAAREKEKYFGSCFIHTGIIFQQPLPGDALVIAEPLISIRYGNASWLGKSFEIFMFNWPRLIWSFAGIADSAKHRVCAQEPWRSFKTLLHWRARGAYTKAEYRELLEPRLESRWARLVSKACAYLPGRVANLLAFMHYAVLHRPSSHPVVLLDLKNSPFCFWKLPVIHRAPVTQSGVPSTGTSLQSRASGGND